MKPARMKSSTRRASPASPPPVFRSPVAHCGGVTGLPASQSLLYFSICAHVSPFLRGESPEGVRPQPMVYVVMFCQKVGLCWPSTGGTSLDSVLEKSVCQK
ncbi:hypothetical protein D9M72_305940 [compost metagenome]